MTVMARIPAISRKGRNKNFKCLFAVTGSTAISRVKKSFVRVAETRR
jgi:hypothetical protein